MFVNPKSNYFISSEAYVYFYVPAQAGIALYLLYGLVGNSMFAGLSVLAISGPLTIFLAKFSHKLRNASMKTKDKRVKVVNEVLSAIKVNCMLW